MDSKEDSTSVWKIWRCGHSHSRDATGACGEQGSREAECASGNGTSGGRCCGGGEVAGLVPQKEKRGVVAHTSTGGSAKVQRDGGAFKVYASGGKRERIAERYDLVPARALRLVAKAMAEGADKYGELNWMGLPDEDIINHAIRHIYRWLEGDRSEPHLSHAAANILMLANREGLDD